MLAYMNREALERTFATGKVTFYSRSRAALWVKGETSGHFLHAEDLRVDCDGDSLLVRARCEGPTCHRGLVSCFSHEGEDEAALVPVASPRMPESIAFLSELEGVLRERKAHASPSGSYTEKLFSQGTDRIAKKVAEESGEVLLAAKNLERDPSSDKAREDFAGEAADLVFHLDMLLVQHGLGLADVARVLEERHASRGAVAPGSSER
jgi:phosphoribosyl-ATP pyrophosphohydrolase/phosphoribosyl-AMP cyclohydrolase